VTLDRLDARDPASRRALTSFRGPQIEDLMVRFDGGTPARTLPPGQGGVIFLNVTLAWHGHVPARLEHSFSVTLSGSGGPPQRLTVAGGRTPVDRRAPIRLGPPLHGGNLLAADACCSTGSHARNIEEFDGRPFVAQRYAIDFLQIDDEPSTFAGDPASNGSYFVYGAPVLAVKAGRVVATRDTVPDNTPPDIPPEALTREGAPGNFVMLDLGGDRFAMYGHLQPGSVSVRPGDRVRRGQVLARVGNSGNSTEAHLHFHVTDGPSFLGANGVPYVFDRFRLDARLIGLETDTPELVPAPPPRSRTRQLPLLGDVVAFPRAD
jgi:hypothetical protein